MALKEDSAEQNKKNLNENSAEQNKKNVDDSNNNKIIYIYFNSV